MLTAVAVGLNRPPCAVTGVAPEAADSDTASGMFSARGNVALPGEELGPWITSEDLAALNLQEVRAYLLLGLRASRCTSLVLHPLLRSQSEQACSTPCTR